MCFLFTVFAFCALLSKHVCGTGKGVTGMLLFRQRKDMAQRPRQFLWDVVKWPYHRFSLPQATTANTHPYVGLSRCQPETNHSATNSLRAESEQSDESMKTTVTDRTT